MLTGRRLSAPSPPWFFHFCFCSSSRGPSGDRDDLCTGRKTRRRHRAERAGRSHVQLWKTSPLTIHPPTGKMLGRVRPAAHVSVPTSTHFDGSTDFHMHILRRRGEKQADILGVPHSFPPPPLSAFCFYPRSDLRRGPRSLVRYSTVRPPPTRMRACAHGGSQPLCLTLDRPSTGYRPSHLGAERAEREEKSRTGSPNACVARRSAPPPLSPPPTLCLKRKLNAATSYPRW